MKIIYNPKKPTMSFKYKGHQVTMKPQCWGWSSGGGIDLEILVDGEQIDTEIDDDDDFAFPTPTWRYGLLCVSNFGEFVTEKHEVGEDLCEFIEELADQAS